MKQSVAVNPRTAGTGFLTDPSAWAIVAGVLAGSAGSRAVITMARPLFGTADTATALTQRHVIARAALAVGIATAGIVLAGAVGGIGRPLGLGLYAVGVVQLIGRAGQLARLDVI